MSNKMHRWLLLALALCVWADVKTHMTLPVELGVSQLRENFETDIVTFYAIVRSVENTDYRWILSFVNFTCDGTCAESTSNFCESTPKLNSGWESHKLDFYPHEGDPAAIHLRRSLEVDGEFACSDGLQWSFDDASSTATLSGQLYLHTISGCDDSGCPVLSTSDVLPFEVSYNTESGALDGLVSRDMTYVYDIGYRRNLWLTGYDTLVELSSIVQTLGDDSVAAIPVHFQNPTILSQTMQPEMKLVGLTECIDDMHEPGCQQNWYLQAQSGSSQPAPLLGSMEIVADLLFSDGTTVQSLLHLTIDVQSPNDPGQSWRSVDSLTSVRGQPYFSGMLNPTAIVKGDRICVTVSSPDQSTLNPGAVRICASQKVDLIAEVSPLAGCRTNIDDLVVYEIMNVATGTVNASFNPAVEQSAEHEYKVCFDAIPLSEKIEVIEVYFSKTSTASVTTSRKRQADGDLYVAQGVPVGCSWSESWDPVVCRCVPYDTVWDNDDWDWLVVCFIIFIFILIIGAAAVACCYYPDYGTCRYPKTYFEGGRTYIITKNPDGSTTRSVVVSGDNNNVSYNSAETASMSNYQKNPKKD
jgi:hypothetical protein